MLTKRGHATCQQDTQFSLGIRNYPELCNAFLILPPMYRVPALLGVLQREPPICSISRAIGR